MDIQNSINSSNNENKINPNLVFAEVRPLNKEKPKSQRIRNSYNQKLDISKDEQTTNITSMYNNQFVNGLNNNFNIASSRRDKLSKSEIENYSKKLSNSFKPKTAHTFESNLSQNVPTNPDSTTNIVNQNLYQDIKISDPKYFSQVVSLPPKYIETVKEHILAVCVSSKFGNGLFTTTRALDLAIEEIPTIDVKEYADKEQAYMEGYAKGVIQGGLL